MRPRTAKIVFAVRFFRAHGKACPNPRNLPARALDRSNFPPSAPCARASTCPAPARCRLPPPSPLPPASPLQPPAATCLAAVAPAPRRRPCLPPRLRPRARGRPRRSTSPTPCSRRSTSPTPEHLHGTVCPRRPAPAPARGDHLPCLPLPCLQGVRHNAATSVALC